MSVLAGEQTHSHTLADRHKNKRNRKRELITSFFFFVFRDKDEMMSGGEGAITAGVKNTKQKRVKKRRPHFARPREKVLRGNQDPLAAVFSWGVR